jgi:hypothetical protein
MQGSQENRKSYIWTEKSETVLILHRYEENKLSKILILQKMNEEQKRNVWHKKTYRNFLKYLSMIFSKNITSSPSEWTCKLQRIL